MQFCEVFLFLLNFLWNFALFVLLCQTERVKKGERKGEKKNKLFLSFSCWLFWLWISKQYYFFSFSSFSILNSKILSLRVSFSKEKAKFKAKMSAKKKFWKLLRLSGRSSLNEVMLFYLLLRSIKFTSSGTLWKKPYWKQQRSHPFWPKTIKNRIFTKKEKEENLNF